MKTRIALIIVPLILLGLALSMDFVLLWRLFYFSVLMLLLGLTWTWLSGRGIRAEATKLTERCTAGEWLEQDITVRNGSRLPKLLVEVSGNSNLPGQQNMIAFDLPGRGSYEWRSRLFLPRRGRYTAGSHTATVSDPFGFFTVRRKIGEPQGILVYPATVDIPFFAPLSRSESGYSPNRWLGSGISPDAARIREYTPGDGYNRIHWRSTAHTQQLMVKVFDPYRSSRASKTVWVVADMQKSCQAGEGLQSTEEYCVTVAASVVKKYLDVGLAVGFLATGEQEYIFPPATGEQHMWRIMEALALMRAAGETPVEKVISSEVRRLGNNAALIVVTPSADPQMDVTLRHVVSRGIAATAVLLDPLSFGGKTSASALAHRLVASGAQVYVVRRGEDLATALDSRSSIMN